MRWSARTPTGSWRHGPGILAPHADQRVRDVRVTDDLLVIAQAAGRTISVPLDRYPHLPNARPGHRANRTLAGAGFAIHWPEVDEDLAAEGLARGCPAPDAAG